jgi:hypothetical protein
MIFSPSLNFFLFLFLGKLTSLNESRIDKIQTYANLYTPYKFNERYISSYQFFQGKNNYTYCSDNYKFPVDAV